jgi:hypothetical protein
MKIFIVFIIAIFASSAFAQIQTQKATGQASLEAKSNKKTNTISETRVEGSVLPPGALSPGEIIAQAKKEGKHITIVTSEGTFSTDQVKTSVVPASNNTVVISSIPRSSDVNSVPEKKDQK